MKIEGYEEISEEEYQKLSEHEGLEIIDHDEGKLLYFKKAQKFPIVFDDGDRRIEVERNCIWVGKTGDKNLILFQEDASFPLLVKAVEKAKEVMKKK